MHCGVASSILDFYLLDASNIPLQLLITSCDNQKCLQALWNVPWWKLHGRKSDALITGNDDKYWYFVIDWGQTIHFVSHQWKIGLISHYKLYTLPVHKDRPKDTHTDLVSIGTDPETFCEKIITLTVYILKCKLVSWDKIRRNSKNDLLYLSRLLGN